MLWVLLSRIFSLHTVRKGGEYKIWLGISLPARSVDQAKDLGVTGPRRLCEEVNVH
jgi:hypothetical protein